MQSRHTQFPANSHFLAALSQVETVIRYLTIKGVTVYGVILRGCRPVIRIDYHKICEQRLLSGQAYYVTFGKNIPGGFKQWVFFTGGCRVIWSESLH